MAHRKKRNPCASAGDIFQFHIYSVVRAFVFFIRFYFELNFTVCDTSRRLARIFFRGFLFALLDFAVHWTYLSSLFLDEVPTCFYYFGHRRVPPFVKVYVLLCTSASLLIPPLTFGFFRRIPTALPLTLVNFFFSALVFPSPRGFLRISITFCWFLSLLYLYYSTNFSFVNRFLKNFLRFF